MSEKLYWAKFARMVLYKHETEIWKLKAKSQSGKQDESSVGHATPQTCQVNWSGVRNQRPNQLSVTSFWRPGSATVIRFDP